MRRLAGHTILALPMSAGLTLAILLPAGVACTPRAGDDRRPAAAGTPTAAPSSSAPGASAPPVTGAGSASPPDREPDSDWRMRYNWAVPSTPVTITNPAPGIPLPYLVEIRTGNHPEETPHYARITFAFKGAFPSYELAYVRQVVADGSGEPVSLPGNAALRVRFNPAQAHDDRGANTITYAANRSIGLRTLAGYAPAGDFEGYVTYGLGIQAAPGSDQTPRIRVGQRTRPDSTGATLYVVAIDVQWE